METEKLLNAINALISAMRMKDKRTVLSIFNYVEKSVNLETADLSLVARWQDLVTTSSITILYTPITL